MTVLDQQLPDIPEQQQAQQKKPKGPSLAKRAHTRVDGCMANKLHMKPKARRLTWHYADMLGEQLRAMVPITLWQVLVLAIFFRKTTPSPGLEAAGLISAVLGLVLFLEGLRVAIMPMAMQVGTQLPQRLKLPLVLLVAFVLGVLVTYAEPAIAAIRPLAALVDPSVAPYLYYMMNQQQEIMVLAIGMGVGVAAVIGTVKFLYDISLKPLIAACLLPTIGLACYMQWGNRHLIPLMGVAWDCGAVTTGPVTVPVLLALGVGVMDAQRQKRQKAAATAVLEDAALKKSEGNTLEGFGIVTLASLLPVLAVELLAVITSVIHPYEYVLNEAKLAAERAANTQLPVHETSPVKEVVYAVRAISPLIIALVLLVTVVLRQPLPSAGFLPDDDAPGEGDEDRSVREGKDASAGGGGEEEGGGSVRGGKKLAAASPPPPAAALTDLEQGKPDQDVSQQPPRSGSGSRSPAGGRPGSKGSAAAAAGGAAGDKAQRHKSVGEAVIIANRDDWGAEFYSLDSASERQSDAGGSRAPSDAGSRTSSGALVAARVSGCLGCLARYKSLLIAMLMCQIGMVLFNLGLTYGFSALGDMTGVTLPASFLKTSDPNSPYYSFAGGVVLTMVAIFVLGILATKAEPALNVLGDTVQTLSGGKFTKRMLIWSVCVGVAVGMCAGACKILFHLPLIYFILVKYAVAGGLTVVARESVTAVAWDSAGVTTGPVTVPFVLAIGIGFSKAAGTAEGFGMLTVMSVAPIISVLVTDLLRRPAKAAAAGLARMSKLGVQRVSHGLGTISGRTGGSGEVDFAAQLRDNPGAMADARLTGRQLDRLAEPSAMGRIGEHSVVQTPAPRP